MHRRGMLKLYLAVAGKGGGNDTRISYSFSYLPPSAETGQAPPVPNNGKAVMTLLPVGVAEILRGVVARIAGSRRVT